MRVGFTGTRRGMSMNQKRQFQFLLNKFLRDELTEFHHGVAVGADTEAEKRVLERYGPSVVKRHPAGRDPLKRNRVIVRNSDVLIVAPATDKEMLRSGTWATIRYARQIGIPIIQLPRQPRGL